MDSHIENLIIPEKKKRKGVKSVGSQKKRRIGRPKKLPVPLTGVKSLTHYRGFAEKTPVGGVFSRHFWLSLAKIKTPPLGLFPDI